MSTTVTTPSPSVNNKLQTIRNWTISTYKCSRQSLYERLGKTNKTVDVELDGQIQHLRDTREKYDNILRLARALTSHFYHVVTTQVSSSGKNIQSVIRFFSRVPWEIVSQTWLTSPQNYRKSFSATQRPRRISPRMGSNYLQH